MTQTETTIPAEQAFLQSLRNETSPIHKQLDSLPVSAVLLTKELTREAYVKYLEQMYPVIKWAELQAYEYLPQDISLPGDFSRYKLLKDDIKFLGGNVDDTDFSFVPTPSQAASFGVAYVIEGSTLGGVYIAKNVREVLDLDETGGLSFLTGNGNTTGSNWKSFLNRLMAFAVEENKQTEIIETASATFEAVHNHLSATAL